MLLTSMWLTLDDHVRKLTGAVGAGALAARKLRGRVWLSRALSLTGLTAHEFGEKYVYRGRSDSGLVKLWLSGKVSPGRQSIASIDRHLPGSLAFYDLPLFELLEDRPLSRKRVEALLSPYRTPPERPNPWCFPNDKELIEQGLYVGTLQLWDCDTLYRRGDFWGFQAIVGLVRLAEATGQQDFHMVCAQNMFRALPSVLRRPWFFEHFDLLYACLEGIRWRHEYSGRIFDVDTELLRSQAADPSYEPNPRAQLRQRPGRTPTQASDPIMLGEVVSGSELRKKRSTADLSEDGEPSAVSE
jgi:hypothetical protein